MFWLVLTQFVSLAQEGFTVPNVTSYNASHLVNYTRMNTNMFHASMLVRLILHWAHVHCVLGHHQ
jgi:hypothetical protein